MPPTTRRIQAVVMKLPDNVRPWADQFLQAWWMQKVTGRPSRPDEIYHPGDLSTWLEFHRSREALLNALMVALAGSAPPAGKKMEVFLSWLRRQDVSNSQVWQMWQSQAGFYFRQCFLPCLLDLSESPWRLYRKATAEKPDWDAMGQLLYLDPSAAADPAIGQRLHTCRYSADPKKAVDCGYRLADGGYRWLDDEKAEVVKTRKIRIGAALQLLADLLKTDKRAKYAVTAPDVKDLWDAVAQDLEGQPYSDLPITRLSIRLKHERQALQKWLEHNFEGLDPEESNLLRTFSSRR
ncbi:MAG: hypothetical protein ACLFVN_09970 [Phycisphaeraceae bacterium]